MAAEPILLIWHNLFRGTVYGKLIDVVDIPAGARRVSYANSSAFHAIPDPVGSVKVSWYAIGRTRPKNFLVFTSSTGNYNFIREVPVGQTLIVRRTLKNGEIIEKYVRIKNTKSFLGLPIDNGSPTQLNFTKTTKISIANSNR